MQILVDDNNVVRMKGIIEVGRYEDVDPSCYLFKVTDGNDVQYAVTVGFTERKVDSLPVDFDKKEIGYYCYTQDMGFYKNPNWIPPQKTIEEQLACLQESVDFLLMQ